MKNLSTYQALVDSFAKLPGVGNKSAQRMASSVLEMKLEGALAFSNAIKDAKMRVHK